MNYDSNEVALLTHYINEDGFLKFVVQRLNGEYVVVPLIGSDDVGRIQVLTQAEYDALTPPDPIVLYIIKD